MAGVGGVDGCAVGGFVILEDAVGKGDVSVATNEHSRAVLQRGRTGGVAVDDVEAVKLHLRARLYGDYVVEAVFESVAVRIAVELRTVVERVARHVVVAVVTVISAYYLERPAALHSEDVERGSLRVFVHKGVTRPEVALKHADFKLSVV